MELTASGTASVKKEKNHIHHSNKNHIMSTSNKRPPDPDPGGSGGDGSGSDGQDGLGSDSLGPPPAKAQKILIEPVRLLGVSNQEEMDIQVLRFQHKKMRQRLEFRQRQEQELLERIQQLETRQTQDDAVLNVMNRYWNQLNEDIRVLLQRFDTETSDESESKNESEATTSFLTQLSTWDKEELDDKLAHRVQVSTRAVAKIIQAFDRLQQRNEKISKALNGELAENQSLDDVVKESNVQLELENQRLQALNTSLHERCHTMSLKMQELADKLSSEETKADELKNRVDDLNWEISKLMAQNDKLVNLTQELTDKYKKLQQMCGNEGKKDYDMVQRKVDVTDSEILNLQRDNEEMRDLANTRLIELENLHQTQKETLKELEKLRTDIRQLPESVIVETTEYKCLQSKFSVVYNDNAVLRQSLDEAKQNYFAMKNFHLKRIEELEPLHTQYEDMVDQTFSTLGRILKTRYTERRHLFGNSSTEIEVQSIIQKRQQVAEPPRAIGYSYLPNLDALAVKNISKFKQAMNEPNKNSSCEPSERAVFKVPRMPPQNPYSSEPDREESYNENFSETGTPGGSTPMYCSPSSSSHEVFGDGDLIIEEEESTDQIQLPGVWRTERDIILGYSYSEQIPQTPGPSTYSPNSNNAQQKVRTPILKSNESVTNTRRSTGEQIKAKTSFLPRESISERSDRRDDKVVVKRSRNEDWRNDRVGVKSYHSQDWRDNVEIKNYHKQDRRSAREEKSYHRQDWRSGREVTNYCRKDWRSAREIKHYHRQDRRSAREVNYHRQDWRNAREVKNYHRQDRRSAGKETNYYRQDRRSDREVTHHNHDSRKDREGKRSQNKDCKSDREVKDSRNQDRERDRERERMCKSSGVQVQNSDLERIENARKPRGCIVADEIDMADETTKVDQEEIAPSSEIQMQKLDQNLMNVRVQKYLETESLVSRLVSTVSEELLGQKKLRAEVIQLEDLLGQVRKEYDMLRIEYEQNLAANEQTGPINREMRHLITSLQNHNQQLKGDSARYRKKYKELSNEVTKVKRIKDQLEMRLASAESNRLRHLSETEDSFKEEDSPSSSGFVQRQESSSPNSSRNHEESSNDDQDSVASMIKIDKTPNDIDNKKEMRDGKKIESGRRSDAEEIKELKSMLKKTQNEQREMKLLLDMYKGCSKDQRDRVQLLASEKKTRLEIDELRSQVKKLQESKKEERKKLADEDALKKIKLLEEQVHALQKQVTSQKLEEETLISDMEVTGQAFEDMQEQNSRLIQQLREKDDANFKLMSDRVKSNQLHKLAQEERELLQEQIASLSKQLDTQNQVVRRLEEKEKVLLNTMTVIEQEGRMRLNASDMNKRKAIESAQSAADLKLHLEKYHAQMKEAQQTVAEKTSALEAEAFKTKRLQEEIVMLKKKLERLNKIEMAGNSDEVMLEEIREYKETLTCPSCKVKRKDAVLSKCFHVFCFDCLRTRYETRQRKCPKCNAGFGANDYHRLYLT